MSAAEPTTSSMPFDVLSDYERRSLAHDPGAPEDIEAHGLWRGIGFRLGERRFLVSIVDMTELLLMPPVTLVPGSSAWILGVANVRGNLAPVVDLSQYLYSHKTRITSRSRVLLVEQPGAALGLLVDEVLGQRSLTEEQLGELDHEDEAPLQPYVAGTIQLGEQRWAVFNINDLIEASQFQQAAV